ncbi:MAG: glycosyltransferase [Candidatus Gastranaerophilales bacterium]|nr:glycosyltransferase [Candidatus Gastranaerophilales bacterium]MCM1072549.1 glycosyltransferase [Bacteroides sp.]
MNVSIIVPAYNVENYIGECLNSLINQSFKNLEIIIVDDGSTDRTREIILEFAQKDSRIKFIAQNNAGPSAARNKALQNASGEYIAFIDADDYIAKDYIEKLYDAVVKHNCDIAVTSMIRAGKYSNKLKLNYKNLEVLQTLDEKINICGVPRFCYVCGKLFKKDIIKNFLFYEGVYFEDVLWLPQVLKNSHKLVTVPDTCYYYRVNYNSIVKTLPSKQKQRDHFYAKKFITKFFKNNNLPLSEKYKNITKRTFYLSKLPLLKIKEKNFINTCYLFSFLPVFKFKDFDGHYIFNFLFFRAAIRHNVDFYSLPVKTRGVTEQKRNPQLIVSLTTHPGRINYAATTINNLLRQTVKPDRLILWLAEEEFEGKESVLPKELLELRNFGLEIRWCENLYSYKKIIPTLREFPNDIIVTADDDLYYAEDWLESLYNAYLQNPKNVYVKRAVKMTVKDGQITNLYSRDEQLSKNDTQASFANQLMGGSGCLFPPGSLYKDILDKDKFTSLVPTHDDIYLWVMAILNNTKIQVVDGFNEEMLCVDGTADSGLCKINNKSGRGISPDEAFARMAQAYPQILEKIKE